AGRRRRLRRLRAWQRAPRPARAGGGPWRHPRIRGPRGRRLPAGRDPAAEGGAASAGEGVIRVLLAEDQELVRGAMAALLSLEQDIEVVAEVGRGDEVLAAAVASRPDVALLDIEMPGSDGITAAAELRERLPGCRVLMLTTFGRPA